MLYATVQNYTGSANQALCDHAGCSVEIFAYLQQGLTPATLLWSAPASTPPAVSGSTVFYGSDPLMQTDSGDMLAPTTTDTCGTPDPDSATCVCDGTTYDFSQIKPTDNNPYFSAPDQDSEYMYYFQVCLVQRGTTTRTQQPMQQPAGTVPS